MSNGFWNKVAEGDTEDYKYERDLWDDGAKRLKKIVENDNDMDVAMTLLRGFCYDGVIVTCYNQVTRHGRKRKGKKYFIIFSFICRGRQFSTVGAES
jgi:hypothetical protein